MSTDMIVVIAQIVIMVTIFGVAIFRSERNKKKKKNSEFKRKNK